MELFHGRRAFTLDHLNPSYSAISLFASTLQNRVMVVHEDDLREKQNATLEKILEFTGLRHPISPFPMLTDDVLDKR